MPLRPHAIIRTCENPLANVAEHPVENAADIHNAFPRSCCPVYNNLPPSKILFVPFSVDSVGISGWLSSPFRPCFVFRFAVLPFCRFGTALVLLRFPLSDLPFQPTHHFTNSIVRCKGYAKQSAAPRLPRTSCRRPCAGSSHLCQLDCDSLSLFFF